MKSFIFVAVVLSCLFISTSASAHPVIRDCEVQKCYKVLFPFPHSKCECVDYRYYQHYVPHRHYHPVPPPRGHRPGHHPSPHHRRSVR